MRILEALDELKALRQFLANLFALGRAHRFFKLLVELVEIHLGEKFSDCLRAHARNEIFAVLLLCLAVFDFV